MSTENQFDRKQHWEHIYKTKPLHEVSWYQPTPEASLRLIINASKSKSDRIIDVGGGDSFLVDHLLDEGYTNLTVLDISKAAIERAKERLGSKSDQINWIVSDITQFSSDAQYDIWHDRAAFHFLTEPYDVNRYQRTLHQHLSKNGHFIVGTFSENGPKKCSGINISQYSIEALKNMFGGTLELEDSCILDHETPFNTIQNFSFATFKKRE
ncbi:MAG: class I SAM-dependent methyltransferase [Bacteroidia bacterium]|nr:class I SAM-dependent methyltransferase [Bacteroidia bacterium]